MLIVRAPMRISFAGGGTDLDAYYLRYGGFVISAAIDRYVYATIDVDGDSEVQIKSSDYRTFYQHHSSEPMLFDGTLALPKAVLHHFGLVRGVKVFLASEVPPGTGLGSSSAVAVALVKGLATLCGKRLTAAQVAAMAFHIEMGKLAEAGGAQDHYPAAFGGLNAIQFGAGGAVVEPLAVPHSSLESLQRRLMLFFTGSSRNSSDILRIQRAETARPASPVVDVLHDIKQLAADMREALEGSDLETVGDLLDRSWQLKKQLAAGVTNPLIDECYALARRRGALGGKITGAGGGGFLMLLVEDGAQGAVSRCLEDKGLYRMDYRFEASGAQVLMNSGLEIGPEMMWGAA